MKPLDIRDIAIIDAFPVYDCEKTVLNVGCGEGRIDIYLASMGYRVYATDIKLSPQKLALMPMGITIHLSDIFDLSSFPIQSSPIVICSQVLEHLRGYKMALIHLLALTEIRLIITIPHRKSFFDPTHCNFWDDIPSGEFKDVHEFIEFCKPYSVSISKIRTRPRDVKTNRRGYLITIDKRQNLMGEKVG
jgi:SAM-dependent methyltransferase